MVRAARLFMLNRIVHLSSTPLAGAPARLSRTLQEHSKFDSLCFVERDYKKGMANLFTNGAMVLNSGENKEAQDMLRTALKTASIVHIHNYIPPRLVEHLRHSEFNGQIFYHLHSPRREGPLYVPRGNEFNLPIARELVVAQMHPRFYPDATPVPNIVPEGKPSLREPDTQDKIRILYFPAEKRGGRWNGKVSDKLTKALATVSSHKDVEIIKLSQPQPSFMLERIRGMCDITIDEISTGGFHQISLEGLQAGNAVINGADEISMRVMMGWAGARPPFVTSHPNTISDDIWKLINDREYLASVRADSASYAQKYMQPKKLIKIYENIYQEAIDQAA